MTAKPTLTAAEALLAYLDSHMWINHTAKAHIATLGAYIQALEAKVEALTTSLENTGAENADLRLDAERYRFLRADNHDNICLSVCGDDGRGVCNLSPENLDACVDAAIAGENMHRWVQKKGLVPSLLIEKDIAAQGEGGKGV